MKRIALYALLCLASFGGRAESLAGLLGRQLEEYPQEKVHLTTDRDRYIGGDTIWFRAFLADAATNTPVKIEKYLYVTLEAPSDSLVARVKVKAENGVFAGYIPLPFDVIESECTLSAHTLYMEGADPCYFLRKAWTY